MNPIQGVNPKDIPTSCDVVLPVFNEEDNLRSVVLEVVEALSPLELAVRFIVVSDGSVDRTLEIACELADQVQILVLELLENRGQQVALALGISYSTADITVNMDGDGQHPVEVLTKLIELVRDGTSCAKGIRTSTEGVSIFKRASSRLFYFFFRILTGHRIPNGSSDFRAFDGVFREILLSRLSTTPFLRGIVESVKRSQREVIYAAHDRSSGRSKYTPKKMLRLALSGIDSMPGRLLSVGGIAGLFSGFGFAVFRCTPSSREK